MSATFHISFQTVKELEALQSEGAPEANMNAGTAATVVGWLTFTDQQGECCGAFDPRWIDVDHARDMAEARDAEEGGRHVLGVGVVPYWVRKVDAVVEVCEAAVQLRRTVTWG